MLLPKDAYRSLQSRRVVLLAPLRGGDRAGKALRADAERLRARQTLISQKVRVAIAELERYSGSTFLPVRLDIRLIPAETALLQKLLQDHGPASIRAVVSFMQEPWAPGDPGAGVIDTSHVVTVCTADKSIAPGWHPLPNIPQPSIPVVRVNTSCENLPDLIADVLIDIAAFYSWPALRERSDDISFRRHVSSEKGRVATTLKLQSPYGPVHGQLPYFCFASAARRNGILDCALFEDAWARVIRAILIDPETHHRAMTHADVVKWVKRHHYRSGQLGAAVEADLRAAPPGRHVLTRVRRRPRTEHAQRQVGSLFGWPIRLGRHRVVPYDRILRFLRSHEYLDFFPFEVR